MTGILSFKRFIVYLIDNLKIELFIIDNSDLLIRLQVYGTIWPNEGGCQSTCKWGSENSKWKTIKSATLES